MIVNGGKKYLRDTIAGAAVWELDRTKKYLGVGVSTNTNAGVVGPTTGVAVSTTAGWNGPANSDFRLSSEISVTRPECSFSVSSNGAIHVQAHFVDAHFVSGATEDYNIYEFGLFLHSGAAPPNSPVDFPTADNKEKAMLARVVNYWNDTSTSQYKTWAYVKYAGKPLTIQFDLIDFGA